MNPKKKAAIKVGILEILKENQPMGKVAIHSKLQQQGIMNTNSGAYSQIISEMSLEGLIIVEKNHGRSGFAISLATEPPIDGPVQRLKQKAEFLRVLKDEILPELLNDINAVIKYGEQVEADKIKLAKIAELVK